MFQIPEDPNVKYNVAWIGIISGIIGSIVTLIGFFLTTRYQKRLTDLEKNKLIQKTEIDGKLYALEQAKIGQEGELDRRQRELETWKTEQQDKWEAAKIHQGLELERIKSEQQRELAQLNNLLQEQTAEKDARRDYEYEARKRLYEQCEPLLFQLSESSEDALYRIYSLARTARNGDLSLEPKEGWLGDPTGYYFRSTVYMLLAPLAAFKLINQRLTLVDLTLSLHTNTLYQIIKRIFISFTDHFEFAAIEPKIEYEPDNRVLPEDQKIPKEKYLRQGLYFGQLSTIMDKMIVSEKEGKRCITYGEFEKIYLINGSVSEDFASILPMFQGFHPKTRSVLWRTLVAQAFLYKRLIHTRDLKMSKSNESIEAIFPKIIDELKKELDWRSKEITASDDEVLTEPFDVADKYLQEFVKNLPVNN